MSDVSTLRTEGGGLLQIYVLTSTDMPDLLIAALLGDSKAARLLSAVGDTVANIQKPRGKPPLCISCPRRLRLGNFMIGVCTGACDNPTLGMGFAICDHCHGGRIARAEEKAREGLRIYWPDLRSVEISHPEGGRA